MNEIALLEVVSDKGELPQAVRLRLALDLLEQHPDAPLVPRTAVSRLRIANVRVGIDGAARCEGQGDASGAASLLWEILVGREAVAPEPPRVHDLVDEIAPDVDELCMRALAGELEATSVGELAGELVAVAGARSIGSREEVAQALGLIANVSAPRLAALLASGTAAGQPPPQILLVARSDAPALGIARGLEGLGVAVLIRSGVADALEAALAEHPGCIVCDAELSDGAGTSLVRRIRQARSAIRVTPIVLLAPADAREARLAGYQAGADVCLPHAERWDPVMLQVAALMKMTGRLRHRKDSRRPMPPLALKGDIEHVSVPTLLSIFEMEGRTGVLEVRSPGGAARLELDAGCTVSGSLHGKPAPIVVALARMLSWQSGSFTFTPTPGNKAAAKNPVPTRKVLLDALRVRDEDAGFDMEWGPEPTPEASAERPPGPPGPEPRPRANPSGVRARVTPPSPEQREDTGPAIGASAGRKIGA